MKRIYVAGPMSGLPELNFPAFHAAAAKLRAEGFDVVNPAEINADPAAGWEACMRADIRELVTCDGIALLPGWRASRGAKLECHIATELGMEVRHLTANPISRTERLLNEGFQLDEQDMHWLAISDPTRVGYLQARMPDGTTRLLHRILAGAAEHQIVDHINRDRRDNRRANLRLTDYVGNAINSGLRRNNSSGVRGVHYHKGKKKWVAQISLRGKTFHLGRFDDFHEAVATRLAHERELHGEFSPLADAARLAANN